MEESLLHGVSSDLKAWKGLQFIHILSLSLTHSPPFFYGIGCWL